jgi:glyoxylase-like metal-dependent hydrolase (beta-lactamase superfamily II)
MRMFGIGLLAIAKLAIAQPVFAEAPSGPLQTIERVAPGIWSIRQRQPFELQPVGNVEVIEQRRGLVLIDGGGSPGSAMRIAQLIKSVSNKPVTAIAITHWHSDHSLGVTTILKTWPSAEVIATNATRGHILGAPMINMYPEGAPDAAKMKPLLDNLEQTLGKLRQRSADTTLPAAMRAGYASALEEFTLYRKDLDGAFLPAKIDGFETERVLDDPVRPVHLQFLGRGNTDGDLIGWLPKQRILATGDLVVAPIPYGFDSYVASWQSALDKLIAFHARTIIPGHGVPMHDNSYVTALRDMISDLRARMASIGPKEDLDQASKDLAPAFAQYQKRFAGDDPWRQKWFVNWWQTPISEALWKESRGIPIEQGGG